ncbi:TPA: hypothetical protein ACSP88_004557, partial [Aeromonas hydrophila]
LDGHILARTNRTTQYQLVTAQTHALVGQQLARTPRRKPLPFPRNTFPTVQLALARRIFDRQHQRLRLQHTIKIACLGRHPGLATDQTLAAQLQQPTAQFQFTVGQLLP